MQVFPGASAPLRNQHNSQGVHGIGLSKEASWGPPVPGSGRSVTRCSPVQERGCSPRCSAAAHLVLYGEVDEVGVHEHLVRRPQLRVVLKEQRGRRLLPARPRPAVTLTSARLHSTPLKTLLQQCLSNPQPDSELPILRGGSSQPRPCLLYRLTRQQAW